MEETIEERMLREYREWLDCEHEWSEPFWDDVMTQGARRCLKCKCLRGLPRKKNQTPSENP